jgi:hypothetical protein
MISAQMGDLAESMPTSRSHTYPKFNLAIELPTLGGRNSEIG